VVYLDKARDEAAMLSAPEKQPFQSQYFCVLADFLIGAHAQMRGYRLLSLDERVYRAAFPELKVETI